jgi:type VI secretion system protein ImpM
MNTAITVGFYGKLPMLGDFVGRRVPERVVETWDAWLQQAVAASRTSLAERWLELYLTAPMWRFFAHPGVLAEQAVAGVMFPSVDRVGRYFPFTVFATLPADTVGLIVADRCAGWFERVEDLVLAQLEEENRDVEDFEKALSATGPILESALAAVSRSAWRTGFPDANGASPDHLHLPLGEQLDVGPTALTWLDQSLVRANSAPVYWWTGGSNVVSPCWLVTRGLPDPLAFSSMLAGDWHEWPWTSFEARAAEAAPTSPLHMESAGSTHPGKLRDENQDAFVSRPEDGLWAVADGMGGHAEGQVASQMVRDALTAVGPRSSLAESIKAVRDALDGVNEYLHSMSLRRVNPVVSGTTVVAMLVRGTRGVCLWAGDSRLYRLRDAALEQLTADHSEAEEAAEASAQPPRPNVITRAIGGRDGLELDQLSFDVRLGDRFLLCSDGLYRDLPPAGIGQLLQHGDATTTAETLIEHALHGEAADNITVVVVDAQPSTA